MASIDQVEKRLAAVERTVVDGEYDLDKISEAVEAAERIDTIDARLDELEERVASLEGIAESLEGYVGNIQSVHNDVEQQADMAIASVDRLEQRLVEVEQVMDTASAEYIEQRFSELEAEIEEITEDDEHDDEFADVTIGEDTAEPDEPEVEPEPQQVHSEPQPSNSETADDAVKQFEQIANGRSEDETSPEEMSQPDAVSQRDTHETAGRVEQLTDSEGDTTTEKTEAEKKLEQIANRNSRSDADDTTESDTTNNTAKDLIESLKTV